MQAYQQQAITNANNHLQALREKHAIEKETRAINESIRREYASAHIDAFTRNMEAQAKVQKANAEREQGRYNELIAFSDTLGQLADDQFEKQKEDQLNIANGIAAKVGLTSEQFQQLKSLESVLDDNERYQAPVYQEMIARGASADDLNAIINSSGWTRYQFGVASMKKSGVSLERFLSDNGDVQYDGFSTTLNAAKNRGLPEYADILQRMQQDYITQNLSGFDPAFIAQYGKPSMDRTLARRQESAAKRKETIDADIYDGAQRQTWRNLAQDGAEAFIQRVQDLTGPDKKNFKRTLAANVPYWIEMLETGGAPDNFVDNLSDVQLQIGNQKQSFGSLHSDVIQQLRQAETKGTRQEIKNIQAEHDLDRAETEQLMRQVVEGMNEKARTGELTYPDLMATIEKMSLDPRFTEADIDKVRAFLPKTPSAIAAKNTIDQWDLQYARTRELPSFAEINSSPLTPDQKIKWFDKRSEEIDKGFTQEYKSRRDEFIKSAILRELEITDVTETTWSQLDPSVHNLFYKLQEDYDDIYGSDLTQDENTRHENSQKPIIARLPSGGSDKPFYTFDGEGFTGKVKSLSLPQSPPSVVTRTQVDEMLKDGNENKLYTQQIVPVSILENYLNDMSSGKRVQMPEAIQYISQRLGVPPMLILEAQIDVANATDGGKREVRLPQKAEDFFSYVKGTPDSTISKYIQSRYHSRNRASRALVGGGLPDLYSVTTEPLVLGAALLYENGVTDRENMITFLAIKIGESSKDPTAQGDYQTPDGRIVPRGTPGATPQSHGWYQHHMSDKPGWNNIGAKRRAEWTKLLGMDRPFKNSDLYDPAISTQLAVHLWKGGGFNHWTVYKTGAWKKYVQEATAAVDRWEADARKSTWNKSSNMTPEAQKALGIN
tara:strand:- start:626 stop:3295 length:2670 start_codon:yes stop_codon:yes gene_type:complete